MWRSSSAGIKAKKQKELSLHEHLSIFRSIVDAAWTLPNALSAHGTGPATGMQANILGGFVLFFTFSQVVR